MTKLIEKREVTRDYGFDGIDAIVDHPTHGRLLIMDGFGGTDTLKGGAVRWEHGMAIKLQDGDTIDGLINGEWNDYTTLMGAVIAGHDDSRPILEWDGDMVESVAKSVGLA